MRPSLVTARFDLRVPDVLGFLAMALLVKFRSSVLAMLGAVLSCGIANAATPILPVEPSVALPLFTQLLPATTGPSFLSGDFNGDGLADTVVLEGSNVTASNLLVLLNNER
jgi:hypothetical protein